MAAKRIWIRLLVIVIVLVAILGGYGWYALLREVPQTLADTG